MGLVVYGERHWEKNTERGEENNTGRGTARTIRGESTGEGNRVEDTSHAFGYTSTDY